jgi:hypothetical protein
MNNSTELITGALTGTGRVAALAFVVGEDGSTATLRLAEPGSSITVKDESGHIEYAG